MPTRLPTYRDGAEEDDDFPLLADAEVPESVASEPSPSPTPPVKKTGRHSPQVFVFLCLVAILAFDFGAYLNIAPQTRIFEDIVCREYYDKHEPGRFGPGEIPEEQCKVKHVQAEVAFVQAMMSSFDAIPSMFSFAGPFRRYVKCFG